jgi:hypothetical protein
MKADISLSLLAAIKRSILFLLNIRPDVQYQNIKQGALLVNKSPTFSIGYWLRMKNQDSFMGTSYSSRLWTQVGMTQLLNLQTCNLFKLSPLSTLYATTLRIRTFDRIWYCPNYVRTSSLAQ